MPSRPDLVSDVAIPVRPGGLPLPELGRRDVDTEIETLRIFATFLLVSYHVLNGPEMKTIVGAGHPLRVTSDFLVDLRMPLFAFIAGYVYALRSIGTGRLSAFAAGKARRLLVPGAIAALAFAATATLLGRRFALPLDEIWRILLYPYVHYWFLQAIFLVLIAVGASEKVFGPRAVPALFVAGSVAAVAGYVPPIQFFSAQGAGYLLPYFALGALLLRHREAIARHREVVLAVGLPLLLGAVFWNVHLRAVTGAFSESRLDLQSWAFAVSACLLLMLFPVRSRLLSAFGAFSFTIYLYHVFGTAGAREVLLTLGIGSAWPHYVVGIAAGFGLPVALHLLARRHGLARRLVLGLR